MDANQQTMMERWAKMSAPSAGHKAIEPMIGSWRAETSVWFGGDEPNMSAARVEKKWALDGRFMEIVYTGDPGPHGVFRGIGLFGYNNIAQRYESMWTDVMSTAMLLQHGVYDEAQRGIVIVGDQHESMTGGTVRIRTVYTIQSKDRHTLENFVTGPDGGERRMLHIVHTRV